MKTYYVYIMSNQSRTLYTGMTNDLQRRVQEHQIAGPQTFVGKFNCRSLVYYSEFSNVNEAIAAEKKIKGWTRAKKMMLILEMNELWDDLSSGW